MTETTIERIRFAQNLYNVIESALRRQRGCLPLMDIFTLSNFQGTIQKSECFRKTSV